MIFENVEVYTNLLLSLIAIFMVLVILERMYTIKLLYLLKKRYVSLYENVGWLSFEKFTLFPIPKFSEWFRLIWIKKINKKDIAHLVIRIRIYEILIIITVIFFILLAYYASIS